MPELLEPDICVIGSGQGAVAAAIGAAALGSRPVLVRFGPSSVALKTQALIAAAERAQLVRSAGSFGVAASGFSVDFGKVQEHVRRVMDLAALNEAPERLAGLGVRVIGGAPRFTDPNTLAIDDSFKVKAKHFLLASGSSTIAPSIEGLNGVSYLTPASILDLVECPQHLIVVGATPNGLELAQAFLRLGTKVTVIDPEKPLPKEDAECVAILLQSLRDEGIVLRQASLASVAKGRDGLAVTLDSADEPEAIHGSHILIASARRPAVNDLDLDKGRIKHGPAGIAVDDRLRTSNPKVYAIGEAAGALSVQAANAHAGVVIRNVLLNTGAKVNDDVIPRVIFTDPGYAHVGLDVQRGKALYRTIRILRWPFYENDRAQAEGDTAGHVKIVAMSDGTIIGATIVGRGAADHIGTWALAVERRLRVPDLAGWVLPYPTRAEAGKYALTGFRGSGLTRNWLRRIMSLLRRRG